METRLERLQRHRGAKQKRQDHWLGHLAGLLVAGSLLYLLGRSPLGMSWLNGATALLGQQ